jgi:hypothetical protein
LTTGPATAADPPWTTPFPTLADFPWTTPPAPVADDFPLLPEDFVIVVEEARWRVDLAPAVQSLFKHPRPPLLTRDGAPAYLAYAGLGALLEVTPERIRAVLDHHRRSQGTARRRKSLR